MGMASILGWVRARRQLTVFPFLVVLGACAASGKPGDAPSAAAPQSAVGNYLAAQHAQFQRDYADAARFFARAVARKPSDDNLIRDTFVTRLAAGEIDQAVPLAQHLAAVDPHGSLAGLVLIVADIKAGKYDAAVRAAAEARRDGAQRFAVPLLEAWAQVGLKEPDAALKTLGALGGAQGLEPLRDFHAALIDDYSDRVAAAADAYQNLLRSSETSSWRVIELAGNFFERHGRAAEAERLYQRSAGQQGLSEVATIGLARIARGEVPSRLIASPADGAAEALFDLAGLLNQGDTADAALVYARLALDLAPHFALAQLLVGEIRDAEGWPAEALALYQSVDPKSSFAFMARLKAALELDALDRTDEAVAQLKTLAADYPTQSEPLVELGDILREHKRFAEAVTAYDGAIARTPHLRADDWRLFYSRGVALERSGQWPRAEADFKQALTLQPNQPLVLNYLGYSWIDRGENLHDALDMVQRAVQLRPNDGYIVDSLGWAYFRLGNFAEATRFLQRAVELLPEDPTINDHLGDAYWRTGQELLARYQWQHALQFKPDAEEAKDIEAKLSHGLSAMAGTTGSGGG